MIEVYRVVVWAVVLLCLDIELAPRPYVVLADGGSYFFKMTPDPVDESNRDRGMGYCYKAGLGEKDELQWSTVGWYADQVFLAADGRHLVRLGNWPRGVGPSDDHLAIAFYADGLLLQSYSTARIVRDWSRVPHSTGHYSFLGEPGPGFVASPEGKQHALHFRLTAVDGTLYTFDVQSGEIVSVAPR